MKKILIALLLWSVVPGDASARDYEGAIETQRLRLQEAPSAGAWNDLGGLLLLAGEREDAAVAFATALEFEADNAEALYNLGVLQLDSDPNASRKLLRSALRRDEDGWTHYRLGQAFERLHRSRLAVRHYARSFELDRTLLDPAVNPEIVGNRLATKSLLRADNPHAGIRPSPRFVDTATMRELLLEDVDEAPAEETLVDDAGEISLETPAAEEQIGPEIGDGGT